MRMHIGLTICYFLLSTVSITEGPKNKIIKKSGIHSSVPRNIFFLIALDTQKNKNCSKVLSPHGTELWMPDFHIIFFLDPQ